METVKKINLLGKGGAERVPIYTLEEKQLEKMGRKECYMSQKRCRVAVEIYLDALAAYMREHLDAGPSQVMRDLPEVGDLRALGGGAIRLYEQAVERAIKKDYGVHYDREQVKQQFLLAQQMLD